MSSHIEVSEWREIVNSYIHAFAERKFTQAKEIMSCWCSFLSEKQRVIVLGELGRNVNH